ncbi:SpoIID/LytB domain-containing protein [Patescibacteria group bacterium]
MRLLKILIIFPFLSLAFCFYLVSSVWATCEVKDYSNPDEYQKAIEECQEEINARLGAHENNKEGLLALEKSLKNTQSLIKSAEGQLDQLKEEIVDREEKLAYQEEILAARVRSYYKRSRRFSPFLLFLASSNAADLLRELSYRQTATNEDRQTILGISQDLKSLNLDKEKTEENKAWLVATKNRVDQQAQNLRAEVEKVEGFFSKVEGLISQLTVKQQALLAARAGTFTTSVGEVPLSNIPCSGPPGTPAYCDPGGGTWFAAFSFGAWTHRKGMSQYGAKGRVEAGQNADQVLSAYYGRSPVGKDTGGTISVTGYGALDFENYYLMGIAEMPSSWPFEALKAQAIAARSYAYRYKAEGRSICTTQACQVFSQSKANNPPSQWREAVAATRGQVIEGVVTYYSSTAGGYLTTSGWDTVDGQGGAGFATRSWESKAGSPWFYSSWFTSGFTSGSGNCGHSHPWLNQEEMADILNAWRVRQNGSEAEVERILPVTINQCSVGGTGGNPYSLSELKAVANQYGGAFSRADSVSVTYSQNGETSSLAFGTDRGSVTVSGSEFKQAFNLRAPGYIAIRSPLFNLEKK